jgi:NAD+ synthase
MDYSRVVEEVKHFLTKKLEETGADGYIIGLSGGIDSAVTAKLAVESVGKDKVYGWVMPGDPSNSENMEDARNLCQNLGINYREISIESTVKEFEDVAPFDISKETLGNVRARTRMIYEYIDANENNLLVLGTGNRSELLIGYFTKYGDAATDISPIADLYKTEVKRLAEHIGLNRKFIEKEPSAGLWDDHSDEDEIGLTYDKIDLILKQLVDQEKSVKEIADGDIAREEVERINEMHQDSSHKRSMSEILGLRPEK